MMSLQYQFVLYAIIAALVIAVFILRRKIKRYEDRMFVSQNIGKKFIQTVPHQVRPPLTAIKGYSSMILSGDYGAIPPELFNIFRGMFISANSLVDIVDDYMDVANLAFGTMSYFREHTDIKEIIGDLGQRFESLNPRVKFAYKELSSGPFVTCGDKERLTSVFRRIIENAMKYTPEGSVTVSLRNDGNGKIIVSVEDTGIGIPEDDLKNLFTKFYRAKNAQDATAVGTGLGLYINAEVVKAHNGSIIAESNGRNLGAKFTVELPNGSC